MFLDYPIFDDDERDYAEQRPDVLLHRYLEDAIQHANADGSLKPGYFDGACLLFAKTLGLSRTRRAFDARRLFWSSSRGKAWSPTLTRLLVAPAYFTQHRQPVAIVAHPIGCTSWDFIEIAERYEIELSVLKVPSWHLPRQAAAVVLSVPSIVPQSMCRGQWRPTTAPYGELH